MTIRSILGRGGLALAIGLAATAAMAIPADAASDLAVAFDCTTVEVESSGKDLSNVVLRFADGDQKFDNLRGTSGTFAGTGAFAGEPVAAVFVKAGVNHSGEGPGYGEQFDAPADSCGATPSTAPAAGEEEDEVDEGQEEPQPASEGGGAEVAAEFDCDNTSVTVTSTKDLSNVVLRLSDGSDVKLEGLSGTSANFDAPPGTTIVAVFVKSGNNGSGAGPGYGEQIDAPSTSCGNEPDAPAAPAPAVTPPPEEVVPAVAPAPAEASVSSDVTEQAAPAVEPGRTPAEVLGLRLERELPAPVPPGAALAFTGITLEWLLLAAGVLLSMGTVLVRMARRSARMLAR